MLLRCLGKPKLLPRLRKLTLADFGSGLALGSFRFFRGAGEVLQGSLVRLVSLWWEFPPRLDSKIIHFLEDCNSFLYFKMKNFSPS